MYIFYPFLQSYSLFGHRYRLLASIHYHLESAAEEEEDEDGSGGGGHYLTYVHHGDTATRIHEGSVARVKRTARPDMDSDAVVIALERMGKKKKTL